MIFVSERTCFGIIILHLVSFSLCELYQVYRRRYDKPLVAARCCHVANDLIYFTDDKRTNEQTNKQKNIAVV